METPKLIRHLSPESKLTIVQLLTVEIQRLTRDIAAADRHDWPLVMRRRHLITALGEVN